MKNFRLLIIAAALAAVVLPAAAQTKIASVNVKKLFDGYYKTKMATAALDQETVDLRKDLKDMEDGLDKAKVDYKTAIDQANDQAISADERDRRNQIVADKAKDISSRQSALAQYQRQAETQLTDKKQRMISNLLVEIQAAVAAKAKSGGYSLVINSANTDAFMFSSSDIDITASVMDQLNAGAPIDVVKPSGGLPFNISTNAP